MFRTVTLRLSSIKRINFLNSIQINIPPDRRSMSKCKLVETDPCDGLENEEQFKQYRYYDKSHYKIIGNRQLLCYGRNGQAYYVDSPIYPMPTVRWRDDGLDFQELRGKERGDWTCLTLEEKRLLYRQSFRQTYAEFMATDSEWKLMLAWTLAALGFSLLHTWFMKTFIYDPMPITFDAEHKKAQLIRMIQLEVNPIDGLTSKWDYENCKWK